MPKGGGGQGGNSMHEGLQAILGMLGPLMATPDADVEFITKLQHVIVARIQSSTQHAVGGGAPGGPPGGAPPGGPGGGNQIAPGGGGGPVGLQSGGASGMGGPGAGPPGAPPGGAGGAPNPDELRRVLQGAGGPG